MPKIAYLMLALIAYSACVKQDSPIKLPPKTGSSYEQLNLGEQYDTTLFYNLHTNKVVQKVLTSAWDIAFDCRPQGHSIIINGGKNSRVVKSGSTLINLINTVPPISESWGFDNPASLYDSAYISRYINNVGNSNQQVYLIRQGSGVKMAYYKFQILSVSSSKYVIRLDTITGTSSTELTINKDENYNFVYFNFSTKSIVPYEPFKNNWDLQFTRYIHPFYNLNPFIAYELTGVLSNPYNTLTGADTTGNVPFESVTPANINNIKLDANNNNIGYNWKWLPDITKPYIVQSKFTYVVKTQQQQVYKLCFTDFYLNGVGGVPKFRYERVQ
jgi:hypothetical protein